MRWKRWIIGTVVLLVVLAGTAYLGLLWYLRSSAASNMVARELSTRLGADVRIDEVDLGVFGSSSARGVKLYDDQTEEPWLSVDRLALDATALQLRSGTMPDRVELTGVRARLRFDRDGKLLTRLPEPKEQAEGKPLPVIELSDSRLTIEQEGRPPFELAGIDAELRQKADGYVLTGDLDDPDWGAWALSGTAANGGKDVALSLSTPRAQIEQSKLEQLPFVPDAVWRHVRTNGPIAVSLTVSMQSDGFHFHLDLVPDGARVEVPSIGLNASDVRGKVVVDDKLVTLHELRGRASGGEVEVKGDLNFRPEPDKLSFAISASKVDLQDFTRTWDLPPQCAS